MMRDAKLRKERLWAVVFWAIGLLILYVSLSCIAFAFRHPELTDTQRFLHIKDAVLWR